MSFVMPRYGSKWFSSCLSKHFYFDEVSVTTLFWVDFIKMVFNNY